MFPPPARSSAASDRPGSEAHHECLSADEVLSNPYVLATLMGMDPDDLPRSIPTARAQMDHAIRTGQRPHVWDINLA